MVKYLQYLLNYLLSFLFDLYYFFVYSARWRILGWRYYARAKLYPDYLKVSDAKGFIEELALQYCHGKGGDVGAGLFPFSNARPIDYGEERAEKIREADGSLDYVFSSHTLEHVDDVDAVLAEFYRVLRVGGILFLYLPHPQSEMWRTAVFRFHRRDLPPSTVESLVRNFGFAVKSLSYRADSYMSYYVVAEKE